MQVRLPKGQDPVKVGAITHYVGWPPLETQPSTTPNRSDRPPGAPGTFSAIQRRSNTRGLEKETIRKMFGMGVIEPSNTEWATQIILLPKKDGWQKFCIDYRKHNAVTISDSDQIPTCTSVSIKSCKSIFKTMEISSDIGI